MLSSSRRRRESHTESVRAPIRSRTLSTVIGGAWGNLARRSTSIDSAARRSFRCSRVRSSHGGPGRRSARTRHDDSYSRRRLNAARISYRCIRLAQVLRSPWDRSILVFPSKEGTCFVKPSALPQSLVLCSDSARRRRWRTPYQYFRRRVRYRLLVRTALQAMTCQRVLPAKLSFSRPQGHRFRRLFRRRPHMERHRLYQRTPPRQLHLQR
jgi:hypothetical protein